MDEIKKIFGELFSLREDSASMAEIVERIQAGGVLKGTNMCILVLAIFIASIGLNMNSTAVIIGAMLISPLMGNIISIGYGMAAYDTKYVKESFLKLAFQVFLSILTSAIYFSLTPITTASTELIARTAPTIWDVLIAIFGGTAGIIGLTREERGNVIPGVAIATALMPPLCTAGYGLATHSTIFFWGALYLFFINSFFICLSAFAVLKILRVPAKEYVSEKNFRRQRIFLTVLGVLIILPSLRMAYISVQENLQNVQTKSYIDNFFNKEARQVVSYKLKTPEKILEVAIIGQNIDGAEMDALQKKMTENFSYLKDYRLIVVQNDFREGLDEAAVNELLQNTLNSKQYIGVREETSTELQKYNSLSDTYYPVYQKNLEQKKFIDKLNKKLPTLFPKIVRAEGGELINSAQRFMIIVYVKERLTAEEVGRLKNFLQVEAESPITLNVQLDSSGAGDLISGNGIDW
ncbi:MAG: DUF389 domain-containing protein [Selenomonadaceae bacterium]|nr:DUF389 domain-containing protein [Selenomonadaceae bacterium]